MHTNKDEGAIASPPIRISTPQIKWQRHKRQQRNLWTLAVTMISLYVLLLFTLRYQLISHPQLDSGQRDGRSSVTLAAPPTSKTSVDKALPGLMADRTGIDALQENNFRIASAVITTTTQRYPQSVYNSQYNEFLVVWWERNLTDQCGFNNLPSDLPTVPCGHILGQRLGASGALSFVGHVFQITEVPIAFDERLGLAYNSVNNEYLVVWRDGRSYSASRWDIYAQRISASGERLGDNLPIATAPDLQFVPTVAYNSNLNEYLIAWGDARTWATTRFDIYGQRLAANGLPLGNNVILAQNEQWQAYPDIVFNSVSDEYMLTWQEDWSATGDEPDGDDIYGLRLTSSAAPNGVPFLISSATSRQRSPAIAFNGVDAYLVVWHDHRNGPFPGDSDIYAQRISATGALLDNPATAADETDPQVNFPVYQGANAQYWADVAYNTSTNEYLVVWFDDRAGSQGIHGRRVTNDGLTPYPDFGISPPTDGDQDSPSISYNERSGNYLVFWHDTRDGHYALYGRIVESDDSVPAGPFTIPTPKNSQSTPSMIYNHFYNEYLVVWEDSRFYETSGVDIYGRIVSARGDFLTEEFVISNDPGDQLNPAVILIDQRIENEPPTDDNMTYLIVWQDGRDYALTGWNIYARAIAPNGERRGKELRVSTATGQQRAPTVAVHHGAQEILIVWSDDRNYALSKEDIFGQRVSLQINLLGDPFKVAAGLDADLAPALVSNEGGNASAEFVAVWQQRKATPAANRIAGQRIAVGGALVGTELLISSIDSEQLNPQVAYNTLDNQYLIAWEDHRSPDDQSGWDIYGRQLDVNGNLSAVDRPLIASPGSQHEPTISYSAATNEFWLAWKDGAAYDTRHWDIKGQLLDSNATAIGVDLEVALVAGPQQRPAVVFNCAEQEFMTIWEDANHAESVGWDIYGQRYLSPTSPTAEPCREPDPPKTCDFPANVAAAPTKPWTAMIYLNGDNDLDRWMAYAFNAMERAANNPDVNVIVLWDRLGAGAKLYNVQYDEVSGQLADYTLGVNSWTLCTPEEPDLDMGDYRTLRNFITWSRAAFPAEHYMLSIVDHGGGWSPKLSSTLRQYVHTGISFDDSNRGNYLSTKELGIAFREATGDGQEKIDLIYFDACLMAMLENGYEIRNYADYLIASENESWSLFPYDRYLKLITATTDPRTLAIGIVDSYHQELANYPHTLSAVDLGAMQAVADATDQLAQQLTTAIPAHRNAITQTYLSSQKFDSNWSLDLDNEDAFVDLYHFASLLKSNIGAPGIQTAAQLVMESVDRLVIANQIANGSAVATPLIGNWELQNAHGISIYLPLGADSGLRNHYTEQFLAFAADTAWDDFIHTFLGPNTLGYEPPIVDANTRSGPETLRQIYLPYITNPIVVE